MTYELKDGAPQIEANYGLEKSEANQKYGRVQKAVYRRHGETKGEERGIDSVSGSLVGEKALVVANKQRDRCDRTERAVQL